MRPEKPLVGKPEIPDRGYFTFARNHSSASGVCPSLPSVLGSGLPRITSHRSFSNAKKSIGWWAWQRDVILKVALEL